MLHVKWKGYPEKCNTRKIESMLRASRRDTIMIYVTLPSNSSMDIYPEKKIFQRFSSFKMNLPEALQVDPGYWEVALKEIQFPHLWYNVRKNKNYFINWYDTVIGYSSNKRFEFKFVKEIKPGYYSSMPEMVAKLNAKIPTGPKTINLHSDGFCVRFDYDSFSNKSIVAKFHGVSTKMEGSDLAMQMRFEENEILCGSTPIMYLLKDEYETICGVIFQHRYYLESGSG